MGLYLKPSEIRYTQETISSVFRQSTRHENTPIGKTLDDLLEASSTVDQVPKITVFQKKGQWYSFDNRRLWVFKKLEELGKCSKIPVKKAKRFQYVKFTTKCDGRTVKLRGGDAGGTYWLEQEEKSRQSGQVDITTSTLPTSTSRVCGEPTAALQDKSKNMDTKRTKSLTGVENDTPSKPSSDVLDLYFSIMLHSSRTLNRNQSVKSDTNFNLPETSDGSDSIFSNVYYNATCTLSVPPEKHKNGPDSTLCDFYNNETRLPVFPEPSDNGLHSTLSDFHDDFTVPVSLETSDNGSDSTLGDFHDDFTVLVSTETSDNGLDSTSDDATLPVLPKTLHDDCHDDVTVSVSTETSDNGPELTLGDFHNDVTLPVSPGTLHVFHGDVTFPDSATTLYNNPLTSSTDTTLMSPVLTELTTETHVFGLCFADLVLSYLLLCFFIFIGIFL